MTAASEAAALYARLGSVSAVAQALGCTRNTARRRLTLAGVELDHEMERRVEATCREAFPVTRTPAPALCLAPLTAKDARERFAAGHSVGAIAREFQVSWRTVKARLDLAPVLPEAGLPLNPAAPPLMRMLALNRAGLTVAEIARRLGCDPKTVTKYLDQAGVERHRRGPLPKAEQEEIARCAVAGMSMRATARQVGVALVTVQRTRERLGLGYVKRRTP